MPERRNQSQPENTDDTISRKRTEPDQNSDSFLDKWKNNRYLLLRISYKFLRGIWIVVMTIGAFIAWLISFLFI